jgi:hypothetical protein
LEGIAALFAISMIMTQVRSSSTAKVVVFVAQEEEKTFFTATHVMHAFQSKLEINTNTFLM